MAQEANPAGSRPATAAGPAQVEGAGPEETVSGETATSSAGSSSAAAGGTRLRGLALQLRVADGYDTNIARENVGEDAAFFTSLTPKARFNRLLGSVRVQAGYDGNYTGFHGESREDFDDHRGYLDATLAIDKKLRTRGGGALAYGHDPRGDSGGRLIQATVPDEWRNASAYGELLIGRRIAKAEIGFRVGYQAQRYLNNNQSLRNYHRLSLHNTTYANIARKLSLVVQPRLDYVDYVTPGAILDSRELSVLAGVRWEATAKTSGEIKVGIEQKDFRAAVLPDSVEARWLAEVVWELRTFSKLQLRTSQRSAESTEAGASLVSRSLEVNWIHGFTPRVKLDTGIRYDLDNFSDRREDETALAWGDLEYSLLRWLVIGAGIEHSYRDSTTAGADYADTRMMLLVRGYWNAPISGAPIRGY